MFLCLLRIKICNESPLPREVDANVLVRSKQELLTEHS